MTRRSFIQNLLGALAVLALPVAAKAATKERLRNCCFVVDPNPPRFNWTGEEFVRVYGHNFDASNPAWKTPRIFFTP